MSIPGVANVAIWGQRDRQYQVMVAPRRLAAQGVSLEEVILGVGNAVSVGGGGFIDTPNQRLAIRHESWARSTQDLTRAVVAWRNGTSLRVGDVGKVVEGFAPPIGDAVINGKPGLLLIVEKYPWGNTVEVTRGVEKALEELRPGLPDMEIDTTIFRPATFIETALANLSWALWVGCFLVVVVLLLFLGRSAQRHHQRRGHSGLPAQRGSHHREAGPLGEHDGHRRSGHRPGGGRGRRHHRRGEHHPPFASQRRLERIP